MILIELSFENVDVANREIKETKAMRQGVTHILMVHTALIFILWHATMACYNTKQKSFVCSLDS